MASTAIDQVKQALQQLGITAGDLLEHKAVMTAAEHKEAAGQMKGILTKNLFLKSKKGQLFLVTVSAERDVDLKFLQAQLGGGGFRFAEADVLLHTLGVKQGSVTPLAIMNDAHKVVKVALDSALTTAVVPILVHPLSNEATIAIAPADLEKFVNHYAKEPAVVVDFNAAPTAGAAAGDAKAAAAKGKKDKTAAAAAAAAPSAAAAAGDDEKGSQLKIQSKKADNFSEWYQEVLTKSEMIEYYDISGCYILRPWSYSIWEYIQRFIDTKIKLLGVKNAYFPIFVPESYLQKEKDHLEGFAPEVAWVTRAGNDELKQPIAIRPTSETVMYPYFSNWIRSHRDLPLRLNQWCNVVRWEFSYPTPFIRSREFLWQEGHTVHATLESAAEEVLQILDIYAQVYENLLCVPVIKGKKTEKEKFAGGLYTTTVEAFIPSTGRGVQGATSHCLGQNFAHMFQIGFEDDKGERKLAWQNSWGLTTRTIGVMVMLHSDDRGLMLPPPVAPIQAIIVPIYYKNDNVAERNDKCKEFERILQNVGVRAECDLRTHHNPGFKFHDWELRGVPLRLELGPEDMKNQRVVAVRRDTGEKQPIAWADVARSVPALLSTIQSEMLSRARARVEQCVIRSEKWSQFTEALDKKCMALAPWCGIKDCETSIKERTAQEQADSNDPTRKKGAAKSLCIPFSQPELPANAQCIGCDKAAEMWVLFGRSY